MSSPLLKVHESAGIPPDEIFMERCLKLAELGAGYTSPNPLVGAVLVHKGRIIGEGYHQQYGGPHAEVNCIGSVREADHSLIPDSSLYVSLEPCVHHGKTPPCTDLILREKIPRVVIGCRDPFSEVNGKGIEKLLAHGVQVNYPVLHEESKELNRRFMIFHLQKRPYVILKWAQSANHKMSGMTGKRKMISNDYSNRLVHKWRSEEAGIMVGTNTALLDNPALTVRLWDGKNPVRIVVDLGLRLPDSLKLFDGSGQTIVLNDSTDLKAGNLLFKKLNQVKSGTSPMLSALHSLNILSVIVEGGSKLLQSFINDENWDEIRTITNNELMIPEGIPSPDIQNLKFLRSENYGTDTVSYYRRVWEYGSMGV
ncbi:MAG TPA: bifunctional diaminohydroxyphosphoribosylaminopyrimidine deaminase/5-amino-6-(5-phosphoribosylamino)uracil reductase RibD [Puia sp.]|nr:bifunctional diaminohydroxyphosphoribosylaminopyrimidine deaminase/5-amino-6-(5-phosphoribosylamino)uracil reductase RibD [Puia sp.]